MTKGFSIVVAMDKNRGIGLNGQLPWKLPGDMRFFRELTTCPDSLAAEQRYGLASGGSELPLPKSSSENRNAVVMGRKTWESLPAAFKPLPNRVNVILSRNKDLRLNGEGEVVSSLSEALLSLHQSEGVRHVFVIGGAQTYAEALALPECRKLYVTEIESSFSCDVFFPAIPSDFLETAASDSMEENGIRFRFRLLQRH